VTRRADNHFVLAFERVTMCRIEPINPTCMPHAMRSELMTHTAHSTCLSAEVYVHLLQGGLLVNAAKAGDLEKVQWCLDAGVNANYINKVGVLCVISS
jgi:hypothetical protein